MPWTKMGFASHHVSNLPPELHTMATQGKSKPFGKTALSASNQYCSIASSVFVNRKMPASRSSFLPVAAPQRMRPVEKFMSSDDDSSLLPSWYCEGPFAQPCPA